MDLSRSPKSITRFMTPFGVIVDQLIMIPVNLRTNEGKLVPWNKIQKIVPERGSHEAWSLPVSFICDRAPYWFRHQIFSEIKQSNSKQAVLLTKELRLSLIAVSRWEFQVGDSVMLNGFAWKEVVLEKVGSVAYKLELPQELSRVHNTFHVSNLKKFYADEPLAVPLDGLHIDDKLYFVEEPVEIMDREVKRLKQSRILIVKVQWNSKRGPELTWECEDQFQKKYHTSSQRSHRRQVSRLKT
ncbi:hypothetical protein Tco_1419283 [Tanacetum coccineum]